MKLQPVMLFICSVLLVSCGKDNDEGGGPGSALAKVSFKTASHAMTEGESDKAIVLQLDQTVESNIAVTIKVSSLSNDIAFRISSSPTISNGTMTVIINKGTTESTILLEANADIDQISEEVVLEITAVNGSGAQTGSISATSLKINDITAASPQYTACLPVPNVDTLEIATWNVKRFPQSVGTVDAMIQLVQLMDVDVIAIQEITSTEQFDEVVARLDGWEGAWINITGDIELGYLFKTSEITSFGPLGILFGNDGFSFPREAVVTDIVHSSGLAIKLINIHLKCCNDGRERREMASSEMKNYGDMNLDSDHFIILGDFNDGITGSSPFVNFLTDTENYFFADMDIAAGNSQNWSYPSFPSHIDHVLCSNELSKHFISSETIRVDECVRGYSDIISDHRPVIARFK